MKVRFTREATGDLHEISAYLRPRNARAAKSVRQAIRRSARVIGHFPEFGRAQAEDEVRKFVVPRYGYLIYYAINLSIEQSRSWRSDIRHASGPTATRDAAAKAKYPLIPPARRSSRAPE